MPLDLRQQPPGGTGTMFGGYAGLSWIGNNQYDPDRAWKNRSSSRRGTMGGGLSYDHIFDLTYNPLKYTVLSPARDLTKPVLGGQSATLKPRIGAYTLDMIDWNSNLAQLSGSALGLTQPLLGQGSVAQQTGAVAGVALPEFVQSPLDFLAAKGIDPMTNGPARLFDYAVSPAYAALRAMGVDINPDPKDPGEPSRFPFQQEGSYWAWLRDSTAEQRRQMAKYQAERTAGTARNAYLRDELLRTFEQDYQMLDGYSSGDPRTDYLARHWLQTGQDTSLFTIDENGEMRRRAPVNNLSGALTYIPIFGTQLAEALDPITAETERRWRELPADERMSRLLGTSVAAMAGEMVVLLPLFSGVSTIVNAARAGAYGSIAARGARLYSETLRVTNGVMATGLTIATANWALSAAWPAYSETLGETIDESRVVSQSAAAGLVNTTGFFTGFYGIETAVPAWFRAVRGQGFASQVGGFAQSLRTGTRGTVPTGGKPSDLRFHAEMGGTRLGRILEREYGIPWEQQGTALSTELMQTMMNLERDRLIAAFPRVAEGRPSGIEWIDNLAPEARLPAMETAMAHMVEYVHGRAALNAELLNGRLMESGTNIGSKARKAVKFARNMGRHIDDANTQAMLTRYGARFFPHRVDDLEALAKTYLRGLGATDDTAALRRANGTSVERWQQTTRRLHQILFHHRNGELHAAAEGADEAAKLSLYSQRHLFHDEIEDLATVLADGTDPVAGQRLMETLIETKDDVQRLHAMGAFKTPEELAKRLIQVAPTLPHRRVVTAASAAGKLNDFQRTLDAEGLWTVGYKPTGQWTLPEGWVDASIKPPPGYTRLALTPDDLRGMGYRQLMPGEVMVGTEFSKRAPIWPVVEHGGGVWVREVPGEQISYAPRRTAAPQSTTSDPALDLLSDDSAWVDPSDWDANPNDFSGYLAPLLDNNGDPVILRGGNRGTAANGEYGAADWPVLENTNNGDKWLFKADWKKPGNGLPWGDLSEARRRAAPTTGKLMAYLDMPTAQEIPFSWNGVRGTIQRVYDGLSPVPLDRASLSSYVDPTSPNFAPENIEAMQKNMVLDWLVGNDDTNAGSFLAWSSSGREPIAIDKGRSFAYIFKPSEVAAFEDPTGRSFWTFRSPQALETHLGEFLLDWIEQDGIVLSRQVVEDMLQKIEAIPEPLFRDWLRPLARARVSDGRFEADIDEFLDKMVARRDGLRGAVNRAYEHIGSYALPKPGEPIPFRPGQAGLYHLSGDPTPINAEQVSNSFAVFPEPDVPDAPRYKAGVVIEEGDGRLWLVDPTNQFGGHVSTFPKGNVDPGDALNYPPGMAPDFPSTMRMAAAREANEETGFSVQLTGHLTDYIDDKGTLIRYYTAKRTGGGPRFAHEKETEAVVLLTPDQAAKRLMSVDPVNGGVAPDPREQAILEAYMNLRHPSPEAAPEATPGDPMASDPTMPGDGGAEPGDSFLSYVQFENGSVFHSPWLDYPMSSPAHIELGNRSVFMQKFDDVFRGWRTYRLGENQRAALHRGFAKLDIGLTPTRIDAMHYEILDAAADFNVPPQAFVLARDWMPMAKGAYNKVDEILKKYMGEGPYLHRDGTVAHVDARHELSKAYQTSLKLNLTAGLTSRMYAMQGPGAVGSFVAHTIYPALRFGFSPIFKTSEFIESAGFNAMRGVNPFGGDPFTEQLMFEMGITRQRGAIRAELASEGPMLQGMTFGFDMATDRPRSQSPWLTVPVPRGLAANQAAGMEPRPPRSLLETLYDHPVSNDEVFPPSYPDIGLEVLTPHNPPDEAGNVLLQFDGRARDDRIIGERFRDWLNRAMTDAVISEGGLHRFAAGIAFVDSLGPDFLDRLADVATPIHTVSSRGGTGLQLLRKNLEDGTLPAAGWPGRGRADIEGRPLVASEGVAGMPTSSSPNVGNSERILGHADAVYSGFGMWEGGDATTLIFKSDVWTKSVITESDRMGLLGQGPSGAFDSMLTPQGAYRAIRQALFKGFHQMGLDGYKGDMTAYGQWSDAFGAMKPVEVATPGGLDWDGIEAIVLGSRDVGDWLDLVATYGDEVPALRDIKVIAADSEFLDSGALQRSMMGYWFEKAGLGDMRFTDGSAAFLDAPPGAWARYLPDDLVTPDTAGAVIRALDVDRFSSGSGVLASLGEMSPDASLPRYGVYSNLEDDLRHLLARDRETMKHRLGELELTKINPASYHGDIDAKQQSLDELTQQMAARQQLLDDVTAWRRSAAGSAFSDARAAREALGGPRDAEAQAWLAGWHELYTARYLTDLETSYHSMRGVTPFEDPRPDHPDTLTEEFLRSRSTSSVYDRVADDVATDLPPVAEGESPLDAQRVAYARFLLDRYRALQPEGYLPSNDLYGGWQGFISPAMDRTKVLEHVTGGSEFRRALVDRAKAKGGPDPGQPIIRLWARGDRHAISSDLPSESEVVITVLGPDGKPYGGMSLDEIAEVWRTDGMPLNQSDLLSRFPTYRVAEMQGNLLWQAEGGPHGSLVAYESTGSADMNNITLDNFGPITKVSDPTKPNRTFPIRFAYHFEPDGARHFALLNGRERSWQRRGVPNVSPNSVSMPLDTGFSRYGTHVYEPGPSSFSSDAPWRYAYERRQSYVDVQTWPDSIGSVSGADALVDDLLSRFQGDPLLLSIQKGNDPLMQALYARKVRGEIPDTWVIQQAGEDWPGAVDRNFRKHMDDDEWKRWGGTPQEVIDATPTPAPSSLDEVVGGPEHLTAAITKRWQDEIAKATGKKKAQLEEAFRAWWNPVPYKERQQDRLITRIVNDFYPEMLKQYIPDMYDFLRQTVKVPDGEMVAYLGQDRRLLDRWLATGSREDFTALVLHAEKYTGKGQAAAARQALTELYSKPEWSDMMAILHWTAKTAQDEAFNVHFFNPYRSSFERSINHPLLGVYPASWAYKAVKEWWRFLYDNDMFSGFRLGMAPAQYIAQLQRQQNIAFAQMSGEDLSKWEEDGPLGSTIFIFNLLLPGDWSALPFPLSRSLRDVLRGNLDPYKHFQNNITAMGAGRDIRLFGESAGELINLATGAKPKLRQNEEPWVAPGR